MMHTVMTFFMDLDKRKFYDELYVIESFLRIWQSLRWSRKKFPAFYGARSFIIVFRGTRSENVILRYTFISHHVVKDTCGDNLLKFSKVCAPRKLIIEVTFSMIIRCLSFKTFKSSIAPSHWLVKLLKKKVFTCLKHDTSLTVLYLPSPPHSVKQLDSVVEIKRLIALESIFSIGLRQRSEPWIMVHWPPEGLWASEEHCSFRDCFSMVVVI